MKSLVVHENSSADVSGRQETNDHPQTASALVNDSSTKPSKKTPSDVLYSPPCGLSSAVIQGKSQFLLQGKKSPAP